MILIFEPKVVKPYILGRREKLTAFSYEEPPNKVRKR